jgi:dethiobiotin synthetase
VTGTDTGVGKTLVACGLLHAARARGLRAVGMKPVAAGATRQGDAWVNDDVVALTEAGNVQAPAAEINPYCYAPPIAPHIAAAEAGLSVELDAVAAAYGALCRRADVVVVEGAGGYLVPLDERTDMADLALRLALPVVLVVGMRLGCINHALLTAGAIRARGSPLAGWVANHLDEHMERMDANVEALALRLGAPLLARVPYAADARAVGKALAAGTLLAGTAGAP